MQERGSKLGITQEVVERTYGKAEPYADRMADYVKGVMFRMSQEQPALMAFIRRAGESMGVGNILVYSSGAAFAYDMLVQSLPGEKRKRPITFDLLNVVLQNILEHLDEPENAAGGNDEDKKGIDLVWFNDKLREDSPAFMDWMGDMVNGLEGDRAKSDFILGSTFVVMPFYMVGEADELEQALYEPTE